MFVGHDNIGELVKMWVDTCENLSLLWVLLHRAAK